jgi:hypothetical protein
LLLIVVRERPTSTCFHQTPPGSPSLLQVSTHSEEVQTPHPSAMLRIAATLSHKGRGEEVRIC